MDSFFDFCISLNFCYFPSLTPSPLSFSVYMHVHTLTFIVKMHVYVHSHTCVCVFLYVHKLRKIVFQRISFHSWWGQRFTENFRSVFPLICQLLVSWKQHLRIEGKKSMLFLHIALKIQTLMINETKPSNEEKENWKTSVPSVDKISATQNRKITMQNFNMGFLSLFFVGMLVTRSPSIIIFFSELGEMHFQETRTYHSFQFVVRCLSSIFEQQVFGNLWLNRTTIFVNRKKVEINTPYPIS